jgi:hypothetical protein
MRLLISGVIYLTVSLPSLQSGWKEIGKTAGNNTVYVDPRSVKTVKGITTARIQVRFAQVVSGAGWKLSRHVAMFDCAKKTVAAKSSTYYSDDAGTKVVRKDEPKIPGYGPAIGGSMTAVAMEYICKK